MSCQISKNPAEKPRHASRCLLKLDFLSQALATIAEVHVHGGFGAGSVLSCNGVVDGFVLPLHHFFAI